LPTTEYVSTDSDERFATNKKYAAINDNPICRTELLHYVQEIPLTTARPFIENWHYSRKVPTGKNVFFGWYVGDSLYAVADYGIGVNPFLHEFLTKITQKPVTQSNLFELKRLCRMDPSDPRYPLTKFLSICHKNLRRDHAIRFIVSFSDPEYNRFRDQKDVPYCSGGIYKAANFEYLGQTNAEMHVIDKQGIRHHRKYAYRYMQRQHAKGNPITLDEARQALGVVPIKTAPKDRWFLDLGEPRRPSSKRPGIIIEPEFAGYAGTSAASGLLVA
jgi:hypothetical protein